jgi:outer membrane protein TolC
VAQAPDRTEISNPFITDQFNHLYGGVAAGLLWKFNFGLTQAKIDQAKAERLKLKAKEAFAQMYLPLDVTQAFLEVKAQEERVGATRKGYQSARRWFLAASSNYDMGLVESKEVSDSLQAYATLRAEYLKAVYALNLGWARLLKAAGGPGEEG